MPLVSVAAVLRLVVAMSPTPEAPSVAVPIEQSTSLPRLAFPSPRRPARLLVVSATSFAIGSALSFLTPIGTGCDSPYSDSPYGEGCRGAMLGFIFGAALFDAAALTTAGIAGRGYGYRDAMRGGRGSGTRRREMLGAGMALVVIGGATTLGATFMPLLVGTTDAFDYPMIGVRQSGVLIGAAGGFLLGYAVVLPRRRVVVRPTVSATQLGVVMRW